MQHAAAGDGDACALPRDLVAFESDLARRTAIPEARARALRALDDAELRRHVLSESRLLRRFALAVAGACNDPNEPIRFVRELDLRAISRDHEWRKVFASLREAGPDDAPFASAAVTRYLEYLRERKTLLEYVRRERSGLEETDERDAQTTRPFGAAMRRLPLGEPVALRLPYRGELRIRLGSHVFVLRDGYPPQLVDPAGRLRSIARGPQSLGRHPENNVVIDRDYNDVSRAHLVLEWTGGALVRVTDLSSRGTFVEAPRESG